MKQKQKLVCLTGSSKHLEPESVHKITSGPGSIASFEAGPRQHHKSLLHHATHTENSTLSTTVQGNDLTKVLKRKVLQMDYFQNSALVGSRSGSIKHL